ncbi:sulfotransferase family cytosolic 1B member 1-like [Pecten maximus]|uniref:sulfotransferase family cytosolic 1B member 1-like n=1 Tax=Pecten maximus TaxID=6579 RepID=UPI00145886EC|nr:sulfotransferase family cytosolic 1B member 1-like [Pecten maximus]
MELIEETDEQGNWYTYKKYHDRPYLLPVKGNVEDQLQMLERFQFRDDDVFLLPIPQIRYFIEALKQHIYDGDMNGFLKFFLSDEYGGGVGGSWFTHTKEWHDGKISNTALKDTYGEIEKLARFLEIDYDERFLLNIVNHVSFDRMKTEHSTEAGVTQEWAHLCEDSRLPVYRKGMIGDWKNHLTVSQSELFDAVIEEKLSGCNIELICQ